jgi:hypothetical protein
MPVGDEEVALVLVLEIDPVLERAMIVAKMQLTRGPHTGKDSFGLRMTTHGERRSIQGVPGRECREKGLGILGSFTVSPVPGQKGPHLVKYVESNAAAARCGPFC